MTNTDWEDKLYEMQICATHSGQPINCPSKELINFIQQTINQAVKDFVKGLVDEYLVGDKNALKIFEYYKKEAKK